MNFINSFQSPIITLEKPASIWKHLDQMNSIQYFWLGRQPYSPIWELQKELHSRRVSGTINDVVLFVEHDHIYTFGKNADTNLLLDSKPNEADIIQIDRGGQVTYHGPGQLVGYPIIDLHNHQMSVSWYMRTLEDVIINCVQELGIKSSRKKDLPGVWIGDSKLCAMGVRLSRWVTMHGFALNINPNMKYFDGMIPCGIFEYGITTLNEQGVHISIEALIEHIVAAFGHFFYEECSEV